MNDFDRYQEQCLRTWTRADLTPRERVINALFGLGESGEILQLFKKAWFHRHDDAPPLYDLRSEIGDVLYYLAVLCHEYRIPLSDIAEANIAKLRARWPDGFPVPPPARDNVARCSLCHEPMPPGEEIFKFHGYSGPCPPRGSAIQRAIDDGQA